MTGGCRIGSILVAAGVCAFAATRVSAQTDSATVIPGARYAPGNWLHEALLGHRYRDLWTTPIRVPVLDLGTYAGGLTPVRTGGFQQTISLRLVGEDGREYNFRSVDKELTPAMPPFTRETIVDWMRQDQTSAQLPAAPVVATALLDAVGVLNPGPVLMVMPDDPRLGEFREMFAGMLGTLEVHPQEGEEGEPTFHGAERVAGTDRLLEHLEEDLDHRVDSRAFLKARLMDVFLGDYDRHAGQWRWARYERDGLYWWVPVPEDRDYAFVAYDGLLLELARTSGLARLVDFGGRYPDLIAMVDNSLDLTRHLLADLSWEEWVPVTDELVAGLTDEVIRDAVQTMPASHVAVAGEELSRELIARRERLPRMARAFYELLSQAVEVHATDADDRIEVDRLNGTGVRVRLFIDGEEPPRYDRVLEPGVTDEVRIYMEGGDDEAIVRGESGGITVHVIGGGSDDEFVDESEGPTFFFDDRGANDFVLGRRTFVDESVWPPGTPDEDEEDEADEDEAAEDGGGEEEDDAADEDADPDAEAGDEDDPEADEAEGADLGAEAEGAAEEDADADPEDLIPGLERDWGRAATWLAPTARWEPHAELVLGAGPRTTDFGFRFIPYRMRAWARALYAPLANRGGFEAGVDFRRRGSSTARLEILGSATNLAATVFHGFGNATAEGESRDLRVWRERARLAAMLHLVETDRFGVRFGPAVEYIVLDQESASGLAIPEADLEEATRIGVEGAVRVDLRDDAIFPRSGALLELDAAGYPAEGDTRSRFGRAEVTGAAFVPLPLSVLALRAGGAAVAGDFPFYDAAFIGGSETLRGHHFQRFAGDRAAFGGASLRVPLAPATILVHGTLGASVFADAGRVWFDGDSPGGWHRAVGGSLWFHVPVGAVSVSYARGEEDRLYFRFGLPF